MIVEEVFLSMVLLLKHLTLHVAELLYVYAVLTILIELDFQLSDPLFLLGLNLCFGSAGFQFS